MAQPTNYRVEVVRCPQDERLFRWRILADGQAIELPGYAYATAWSAAQAGQVALYWYLALQPGPEDGLEVLPLPQLDQEPGIPDPKA